MLKKTLFHIILENLTLGSKILVNLLLVKLLIHKFGVIGFGDFSFWMAISLYIILLLDAGVQLSAPAIIGPLLQKKDYIAIRNSFLELLLVRLFVGILLLLVLISLPILLSHSPAVQNILMNTVLFNTLVLVIINGILNSNWAIVSFNAYRLRKLDIGAMFTWLISAFFASSVYAVILLRFLLFNIKDLIILVILYKNINKNIPFHNKKLNLKIFKINNILRALNSTLFNFLTSLFSTGYRKLLLILPKFILDPYLYGIFSGVYKLITLLEEVQSTITRPMVSLLAKIKNIKKYWHYVITSTIGIIILINLGILGMHIKPLLSLILDKIVFDKHYIQFIHLLWPVMLLWGITGHINVTFLVLKRLDKPLTLVMFIKVAMLLLFFLINSITIIQRLVFLAIVAELINLVAIFYFVLKNYRINIRL